MKKREPMALYSIRGWNSAGDQIWDLCQRTTFLGVLVFLIAARRPGDRFSVSRVGQARQGVDRAA